MTNKRLPPFRSKLAQSLLIVGAPGLVLALFFGRAYPASGGIAMLLLVAGVFIGKNTLICAKCEKKRINIGVETACCHECGHPYFPDDSGPKT